MGLSCRGPIPLPFRPIVILSLSAWMEFEKLVPVAAHPLVPLGWIPNWNTESLEATGVRMGGCGTPLELCASTAKPIQRNEIKQNERPQPTSRAFLRPSRPVRRHPDHHANACATSAFLFCPSPVHQPPSSPSLHQTIPFFLPYVMSNLDPSS
ncbi:hypothetical protein LZ30DRAFT_13067 [Colletotrichum cereale]|nr:hypothetical protein LZ30DRAFT_13067 [Colletotrichum cereale]